MTDFDVSKNWIILIPADIPPAKKGAEELSRCIDLLRKQGPSPAGTEAANLSTPPQAAPDVPAPPLIRDTGQTLSPKEAAAPVILLNCDAGGGSSIRSSGGFSWRAGAERVEIYGKSPRGLIRGLFHFLESLGLAWPAPGEETLPPANGASGPGLYPLKDSSACVLILLRVSGLVAQK
jgi:hypothetical protein